MGYWPSYDQIPASCRAAYLSWLANGRQGGAYIGYVFLFFYGLERRALIDAQTDPEAEAELPTIRAEVARLLTLFGDNRSFQGYATAFLDTLEVLTATGAVYDGPPPEPVNYWELPARLKVGLGQLAAEGKPVPPAWALAWVRAHPEARLRTPAKRCPLEFAELFARRYAARYGEGIILKANKTKLVVAYRPASAGFGGTIELTVGSLPDVSALTAPVRKLSEITDACTDALDAYSRWIGRNPDGAGTLPAAALVPAELLASQSSKALDALRDWTTTRLGDAAQVTIDASDSSDTGLASRTASSGRPSRALFVPCSIVSALESSRTCALAASRWGLGQRCSFALMATLFRAMATQLRPSCCTLLRP